MVTFTILAILGDIFVRHNRKHFSIDKGFLCFESMVVTAANPFSAKYDVGSEMIKTTFWFPSRGMISVNKQTQIVSFFLKEHFGFATYLQVDELVLNFNFQVSRLCRK